MHFGFGVFHRKPSNLGYLGYISKVAAVEDCQNNQDQRSCGLARPLYGLGYQGLQNPLSHPWKNLVNIKGISDCGSFESNFLWRIETSLAFGANILETAAIT